MIDIIKKIFNTKNLIRFIFFTFAASSVYVSVRIAFAPAVAPLSETMVRVKGDYSLMLMGSVFGAVALLFPGFLTRKINLNIPPVMIIIYAVFLYCAIYLGEVRSFYYNVPHWDTILHTFRGAALGALGFSIISVLNKSQSIVFILSPVFVALFSLCFAMAFSVIWEIYEFTMDIIMNTNMQRYALDTGKLLVGQEALADTMKDMIVDTLGATVISAVGYISIKSEKKWLERLQLKKSTMMK